MRSFTSAASLFLLAPLGCSAPATPTGSLESPTPTTAPTTTPTTTPTATVTATSTAIVPSAPPTAPTATTRPPTPTPPPTPHELLPPLFAGPAVHAERAVPIVGGTLLVSADGTTAVAADPDRDRIFLVDLASHAVRAVAAEPGDEPGRLVEGAAGALYVVARRAGAILVVDRETASITARIPVCAAPRGLAYDSVHSELHVACRSGLLASIDVARAAVVRSVDLDTDLRDVIVRGDTLLVSRFRSAEIIALDAGGNVTERTRPPPLLGFAASVLFRTLDRPNGSLLLSHQVESDAPLGTGFGAYYGGSCFGGGVVQQALTVLPATGSEDPAVTIALPGLLGPTDLALSRDGSRIAVLASGNSWIVSQEQPTLFVGTLDASGRPAATFTNSPCGGQASQARYLAGEPVSVAFDAEGRYLVQSREPALLELEGDVFISLSDESHYDSGLAMFYLNTGGNISCASCHPEGGDDGHTWAFSSLGYRRSQSLAGGVSASAPFHWSGDIPSFDALFTEVMLGRMALPVVPPTEYVTALSNFLDALPAEAPPDHVDPAAVERGRLLFSDTEHACSTCHSGPKFADGRLHDVGTGGQYVTPSLLGVAQRTPLMHDGCAPTLRARFGVCGGTAHGDIADLSETEIDDLVAFLASL